VIPHGVAGAIPALTRPGSCLGGQTTFGTAASAKPCSTVAAGSSLQHGNCRRRHRGQQRDPQSLAAQNIPFRHDPAASPAMDLPSIRRISRP